VIDGKARAIAFRAHRTLRYTAPMTYFAMPVSLYMTAPVACVREGDPVASVQTLLAERNISAVAVTNAEGSLSGVITRTDLLRIGKRQADARRSVNVLTLPAKPASEVMEPNVLRVKPDDTIASAASTMVEHHVHRLFVEDQGKLVGVLSTRDLMVAVRDRRVVAPISSFMSSPVFTIGFQDPIATAVQRLEKARVSGLVVVEDDWPIGVFTQAEALESKDAPRTTPVEEVLNPAMLCLDVDTQMHRAAAQAASMDVRRVIAVHDRKLLGILTGIDFARAASE
jgi:CBS-domain-containing membrane protein